MPSIRPRPSLLDGDLEVNVIQENALRRHHIDTFLGTVTDNSIGLAPVYGPSATLSSLAFASQTHVLQIRFSARSEPKLTAPRKLLQGCLLGGGDLFKYAFLMDKLVFTLYHRLRIRVSGALGLLPPQPSDSFEPEALVKAFKSIPDAPSKAVLGKLFSAHEGKETKQADTVHQSWLALHVGTSPSRSKSLRRYDSEDLDDLHLAEASKHYCLALQLRQLKPTVTKNEVTKDFKKGKGFIDVTSTRFKTRITSASKQQTLQVRVSDGGREYDVTARTTKVEGRGAQISHQQNISSGASIVHIKTIGREKPTNAEEKRHKLLANVLEGKLTIFNHRFVQTIFFPELLTPWPRAPGKRVDRQISMAQPLDLNPSQKRAVDAIISLEDRHRVVLVHGPPGTGKTTVIAASTQSIVACDTGAIVWLVAHSNVAVKNIAEKLVKSEFLDFKIIVSKEFHFDWHEHLYHKVERNLIRTDSLPDDILAAHRLLLGSRVILSTLSSLLNNQLAPITLAAPVQNLIVDEASQVDVGDYLTVINRYQNTLEKIVFIGDDKQLAPYGAEQIQQLESIFEKRHLRVNAVMLDTQYRMPVPIGRFISEHVYQGHLRTSHKLTSRKTCQFVDVHNSKEQNSGKSWVNHREAGAVVGLAKQLNERKLAFRIITPYDPQRSYIENQLKHHGLPFEDTVFNVDSFQGNEADYIIVSLVRSAEKMGFLQESRRVNVMLTRCKKGMVICTNRPFVEGVARDTLVGKLATRMSQHGDPWLDSRKVLYAGVQLFA